jgi:hypothetical protein
MKFIAVLPGALAAGALVKRIVEASGGDVRYEHEPETRFVLSFPKVSSLRSHRIVQPIAVNTPPRVEVHT